MTDYLNKKGIIICKNGLLLAFLVHPFENRWTILVHPSKDR